jgi:hypothetical protein
MRTFTVILTTGEVIREERIVAAGNGGNDGLSFAFENEDGTRWIGVTLIAAMMGTTDADTIAVAHARAVLAAIQREAQRADEVTSGRIRELREV